MQCRTPALPGSVLGEGRSRVARALGLRVLLALALLALALLALATGVSAAPVAPSLSVGDRERPDREAFRLELERAWPEVTPQCLARALTGDLPSAKEWSEFRSLAWPARGGPRVSLWDRLESELESRGARALCIHPRPPESFRLEVPSEWNVRSGRDWLMARAPGGDLALEAIAFPSVYAPKALAARSRSLLERNRRVHAQVLEERSSQIAGHAAFSLTTQFRVAGRDLRVRATWLRLGARIVRVMGVAEIEAEWRQPGLLRRIEASIRARDASTAGP